MGSAMVLSVNITSPCWSTRTTELVLKYTQQKHVAINVHTTTNHKEDTIIPAHLVPYWWRGETKILFRTFITSSENPVSGTLGSGWWLGRETLL